jgi:RND family efflux transporter MFP subunit
VKRVVLAVTFLWLVGCEQEIVSDKQTSARPVRLWSVTASQSHPPMHFVGEVAPARTVDLGFEVDGTLKALPISEGEVLQAGDVVAQLDPRRFELALESALADHELARKTLERVTALKQSETVSQADLDEAIARETQARLSVETARTDLEDTVLNAPFASRIIARLVENYASIGRLEPVIRLAPLNEIEIVIGVPEQLMATFNPSQISEAQVRFSADPERLFPARWLDYEAQVNRDTQTFGIRFSLTEAPPWPVLPGMTATMLVSLAEAHSPLPHIPVSALQADATGQFFVWVVDEDTSRVYQRTVEAGMPDKNRVPIPVGLAPGDQIVAAGGAWLVEGMLVRPLARD